MKWRTTIGIPAILLISSMARADVVLFDNLGAAYTQNYTGEFVTQGPTGSSPITTRLFMTKITFINGSSGQDITGITFSVYNNNSASVRARSRLRFWNADGASGAPGSYYTPGGLGAIGYTLNPIEFEPGLNIVETGVSPGFIVPQNGSAIWAGLTFDNSGTPTTGAQMANLGQGLFYSPALVGTVGNEVFETTNAGSFFGTNNPAGAFADRNVNNQDAAYGWKFTAVPEPSGFAAMLLGGLVIFRRRTRK
ncbi:MAG TPA: PEP-CTERM sorting domain-containing protein [Fimbriimonadaceae bacterium]|nr:PEP-CTERM sorting domain-containing protein [Fimbriimonadaceae bacterium]